MAKTSEAANLRTLLGDTTASGLSVRLDCDNLLIFRDIVEASPAPILVVAAAGPQLIEYANTAFHRVSGYSDRESIGHNWTDFFVDEHGGTALRAAQQAISAGRESREVLWARRKDGSRACLKLKVSALGESQGRSTRCVMVLHDMTAERQAHDTLEQQAHFDALTGLANRHLLYTRFEELLDQARTFKQSFSVALLDMDDFKMVNDGCGHEVGDELLKCVGERLMGAMRAHDMVGRLGGDEFALLLPDMDDGSWRTARIAHIVHSVQQPVELKGYRIQPACSIGVSHCPSDGTDRESLMRAADRDLYRAKAARPNRRAGFGSALHSGHSDYWPRFKL